MEVWQWKFFSLWRCHSDNTFSRKGSTFNVFIHICFEQKRWIDASWQPRLAQSSFATSFPFAVFLFACFYVQMDTTEDLSARILLKHILSTEPPRTPVTRRYQTLAFCLRLIISNHCHQTYFYRISLCVLPNVCVYNCDNCVWYTVWWWLSKHYTRYEQIPNRF